MSRFCYKIVKIVICFIGDPEKQGDLIKQLQEQHYIQYMQQLQAAQRETSDGKKEIVENEDKVIDKVSLTLI